MMQLAGALVHVPLELGLVRAQLRFRVLDAIRHGVEGIGKFRDLRGSRRVGRARCDPRRPGDAWPPSGAAPAG